MVVKLQSFMIKKFVKKKLDPNHTCLGVITLGSALKKDDSHYPLLILKECKYIEKS